MTGVANGRIGAKLHPPSCSGWNRIHTTWFTTKSYRSPFHASFRSRYVLDNDYIFADIDLSHNEHPTSMVTVLVAQITFHRLLLFLCARDERIEDSCTISYKLLFTVYMFFTEYVTRLSYRALFSIFSIFFCPFLLRRGLLFLCSASTRGLLFSHPLIGLRDATNLPSGE